MQNLVNYVLIKGIKENLEINNLTISSFFVKLTKKTGLSSPVPSALPEQEKERVFIGGAAARG